MENPLQTDSSFQKEKGPARVSGALWLYSDSALDLALVMDQDDTGDAGRDSGSDCRVEDPVAGLVEVLALGGFLDIDSLVGILEVSLLGDLLAIGVALQTLEHDRLLTCHVGGLEHHGDIYVEIEHGGGEAHLRWR